MRVTSKNSTPVSLINLKDQNWLDKQRVAGKAVAYTLWYLQQQIEGKMSYSLIELNNIGEYLIKKAGCTPTFKNYKGFPAGVCISVNKQLVHGIPTDYKLQDGDKVSFDLGATYDGAIADSAITCIYGEPKDPQLPQLIKATEEALMRGIAAIKVGNQLGCIGNAIYKSLKNNYNVIENYGGHGICMTEDGVGIPHAAPFVANKANVDEGIRLCAGMTLAIEPMAVPKNCSVNTKVNNDGWSVITEGIGCHWEHTVFIHEDYVEIITDRTHLPNG